MVTEYISLYIVSYLVNGCLGEIVKEACKEGDCGLVDDVNPIQEEEEGGE